ncbi:membrane fusion protein, macrolide-specific efflux system [Paenibacillus sp. UNCCL117]|uniref:efflux RND transporter periplasmic adaptor subunit n=1 Tax=unclassified Paenibacillus TaxID=185978 RepID=UPI000882EA40|nr:MULTISPECIES: efflux RND transporter periplasmic adaptor subunit [unclassified Paenibacillus]SDC21476.1 membrane fusion protein, macrolide-specific efflux system [Paenibacillus sp. cl123]SFW18834.1 membrane fusion protein, macrolide-specific efflux system [Paenibacillus sp. UNCCL117]
MKKKAWLITLSAVVVVGVTGLLFWQSRPVDRSKQMAPQTLNALKFQATREDLTSTVEVKGKSSYRQETYINAPFASDVKSWDVKEGQQVQKGDILFRLVDTTLRNEIAELQAAARKQEMEIRLGQFQATLGAGEGTGADGVSETEAKQRFAQNESRKIQEEVARMSLEHARTQLNEKSDKLKEAQFPSPENGIFLFDAVKEPKNVKEGERIGKIVDLTQLQLLASVGEYDLFRLAEGMPVEVRVDALKGLKLQGKVERLSKFAKGGSDGSAGGAAQFEVVISLEPNDKLIAGLSLTASIQTDKKSGALVIPTLAVQRDKDEYYVMVETSAGSTERRVVQIGVETPDKTEIVEGLQEGDTVVIQ